MPSKQTRDRLTGLYDPRQGGAAIRVQRLRFTERPTEPARTNCFSIYLIESGNGTVWADASQFSFTADSLLFFVPYQHIRFEADSLAVAAVIQFHANFLCVETFHAEVGCSGVLFNDPYGVPIVSLEHESKPSIVQLIADILQEHQQCQLASHEVMLALLKILLIRATRLKATRVACVRGSDLRHPVLAELRELIEHNYCRLHLPADYAKQLHLTAKSLGRIVREHLGTTPTELIRSRILIHAKWQLLHTLKPVKVIAREVGFSDELYFSRLFKKATGLSPSYFREFETEIRGGSNLSMDLNHAPILTADVSSDT